MNALDRVAVDGGKCSISPRLDPRLIVASMDWLDLNATPDDEYANLFSAQAFEKLEAVCKELAFAEKREAFYDGPGSWLDEITDVQIVDEYFDNADFLSSLGGVCRAWQVRRDGAKRRILFVDF